jgi:hypothetical protein
LEPFILPINASISFQPAKPLSDPRGAGFCFEMNIHYAQALASFFRDFLVAAFIRTEAFD